MDEERTTLPRGIWWAMAGLVLLLIVGLIASFYLWRSKAKKELVSQTTGFEAGVSALENLDFGAAAAQFQAAAASSTDLKSAAGLFSVLANGKNPISMFADLSKQLAALSDNLQDTENDILALLGAAHSDRDFPSDLASLNRTLHAVDADGQNLTTVFSAAGTSLPNGIDLVDIQTRLHRAEAFLDVFVPWLTAREPHHVLVLLQNPSELRAAGGFLGSYADVTIASGTVSNVAIHDIADVDVGFTAKIIPPKPLQLEISKWRPADANWFFDFPTSASQTLSFFEQSSLYAASGTKFDGTIAVSPKVIGDLLALAGPITVTSSKTTFDSTNFLVQIQKIVQAGQAQSATYPKQVLKELTTALFAQLASSTPAEQQQLIGLAGDWIAKKEVMAYFREPAFENLLRDVGAVGDVYALPQNFEGDYLALVDTNINGQKSDLYISETVDWQGQINDDGTVSDHVTVGRKHGGDKSPYWWYQAANQSYIQLFAPSTATFVNSTGGMAKNVPAPLNYAKSGFAANPLVAAIESSTQTIFGYPAVTTHEESGKEVFTTWSRVAAGSSTTLTFDYSRRLYLPVADGTPYQLVFEKQPGTNRHYHFELDAPLGYIFAETGLASWNYESGDPPGRLVVDLTLQKSTE